jgi:hypothetical protein
MERLPMNSFRQSWKKPLLRSLHSALKSMLQGTGKWEWLGHDRMRRLEDTFETGLQDGTLVTVRVTTEIVVTPILWHAACNIAFLIAYEQRSVGKRTTGLSQRQMGPWSRRIDVC